MIVKSVNVDFEAAPNTKETVSTLKQTESTRNKLRYPFFRIFSTGLEYSYSFILNYYKKDERRRPCGRVEALQGNPKLQAPLRLLRPQPVRTSLYFLFTFIKISQFHVN